ncbi:MAG TPA: RNA polymerase sigma factor [Silvibacterium sp.]|nr:RNA polymerase sigma factor [Silvibacterium sp.]
MSQQDRQISEAIEKEKFRLRNFIRRRVADESDAEDVLQDVFYELIEAYRSMKHIEQVTAWLFAVARNRITDLFRKRRRESTAGEPAVSAEESEKIGWVDLLPSPDAGPEAAYLRSLLIEELDAALEELPQAQRDVFIGHALIGYSFKELAEQTGESVNTLLSRKHYAVLHLRERLESVYKEFRKK